MRYRVMGAMQLWRDESGWVTPGAAKNRILLATLLARANRRVSNELIQQHLWGEDRPKSAAKLIHLYVHQIRHTLSDTNGTLLLTRPQGYELTVDCGDRDVDRFAKVTARGFGELRSGDLAAAAASFQQAQQLWRGTPYVDLLDTDLGRVEASALEEQLLLVTEARVDIQLCLGRHVELIGDLRALVLDHPLRERFHEQLIAALYLAGRRAEAAKAFECLRDVLDRELGMAPGRAARQLLETVLTGGPAVDALADVRSVLGVRIS